MMRQWLEPFKSLKSIAGVSRRLSKWKIHRKRGRQHIHSPDPLYHQKLQAVLARCSPGARPVLAARTAACALPQPSEPSQQTIFLYGDEKTVYRQPKAAKDYGPAGSGGIHQPLAGLSHRGNTKYRLAGAINAADGQVVHHAASRMGVDALCRFLEKLREVYPRQHLVLAWDNWPVHYHPKVLKRAKELEIQLLNLPTYAPWTNPIEKLWRWLGEEMLDMHRLSDSWDLLKQRCFEFLQRFERPSPQLLRYVGLLPD